MHKTLMNWFGNGFLGLVLLAGVFGVLPATNAQTSSLTASESSAAELLEKHKLLLRQLEKNVYGRPLYLESSESSSMVSGNAYAVLDTPFATVSTAFKSPNRWCEVMILPINTKYCRAASDTAPTQIKVNIGKKTAQDLADSFALEFNFRIASVSANYLAVQLNADKGPLGTSDYRIELRAMPLPDGKTFMHLRYAYGYGFAGRIAMQGYLATVGSGKVGFTQATVAPTKTPAHVGGMRGAVERNTVRYYLAIDAYLAALNKPVAQQFNARLEHWFDSTEQYPEQFRDLDKNTYLAMKKFEYQRQQTN